VTLSMDEAGRPICSVLPQDDAHRWPWSDDRRTMRPTGWGKYGYTGVHEIVSGTDSPESGCWRNEPCL